MNETLTHLSQVVPVLVALAAVFGFLGWSVRGASNKSAPAKTAAKPAPTHDKGQQDRVKHLEAALEKSKAANKGMKTELENLHASTVSKNALEIAVAELETARKTLDTEAKRVSTLETDLRKSQDTLRTLNARVNEGEKAQKDRSFALQNELSKTREQLAILQNRPDDSAGLHAEIERLRESVAVSTRFAGEMRKREAAAVEALEKSAAQLASSGGAARPVAATERKLGPVVDSGRIAAAKAEVIRLVELNKQKNAETPVEAAPVIAQAARAIVEESPAIVEAAPAIVEAPPTTPEAPPTTPEAAPTTPEAAPTTPEAAPTTPEAPPTTPEAAPTTPEVAPTTPEVALATPDEEVASPDDAPPTKKPPVGGDLFAVD